MIILVTGGAGYIGSHTCVELLERGYDVIVADNLSNSDREAINRVEEITGNTITFYQTDLLDFSGLEQIFKTHSIDAVIHFAGLKAVGESVSIPLKYYRNNIVGTLNLCELMQKYGVFRLVFSSSATVYGDPATVPITEDMPLSATNPYGSTKLYIEGILRDLYVADNRFAVSILRYFNPVGAHKSGRIGENPTGIPNNLPPYIAQVACGNLLFLRVFGDDYPTADGTGVRDYIHVVDLAEGHLKALELIWDQTGVFIHNLGTGRGYSVLEVIQAFEQASGVQIPYQIEGRRPGDIAVCYADVGKAKREMGFEARFGMEEMCADAWRWQSQNPNGF